MRRLIKLLTLSFLLSGSMAAVDAATTVSGSNARQSKSTAKVQVSEKSETAASGERTQTAKSGSATASKGRTVRQTALRVGETADRGTQSREGYIRVGRERDGSVSVEGTGTGVNDPNLSPDLSYSASINVDNELSLTPGLVANSLNSDNPAVVGDGQSVQTQMRNATLARNLPQVPDEGRDLGAPDAGATPMSGPGSPGYDDVVRMQEANRTADRLGTAGTGGIGGTGGFASNGGGNAGLGSDGFGDGGLGDAAGSNNLINGDFDSVAQGSFQPPTSTGSNMTSRASNLTSDLARESVISRATEGANRAGTTITPATAGTAGATNSAAIVTNPDGTVTGIGNFGNTTTTSSTGDFGTTGSSSTLSGNGGAGSAGSNGVGLPSGTTSTGTAGQQR